MSHAVPRRPGGRAYRLRVGRGVGVGRGVRVGGLVGVGDALGFANPQIVQLYRP